MKLISREKAIEKELPRYFTGIPCKKNHIAEIRVCDNKCFECAKLYDREYKKKNRERIRERDKIYYYKDIEKARAKRRYYSNKDIEKTRAKRKIYRDNNRERIRAWKRKYEAKQKTIPEIKLVLNMRSRISGIISRNHKNKQAKTIELLGCNGIFLRKYIQKRFKKGMSWDNYGKWHIDHITPIDYFIKKCNFNSLQVQKKCFNYKNLQPMWAEDNLIKGAKLI